MALVTVTRMYARNKHGDLRGLHVKFIAHDNMGKPIIEKMVHGKVGTPEEPTEYQFDIGGLGAKTVSAIVMEPAHTDYGFDWKV